jgi:hypothetical protein
VPAEDYVRPPIVATERPDQRLRAWRFRVILLLLLVALGVGAFYAARAVINNGEGNPQAAPSAAVSGPR